MRYLFSTLLAVVLILAGCDGADAPATDSIGADQDTAAYDQQVSVDTTSLPAATGAVSESTVYPQVQNLTNDQKLMLIEEVPLGLTYEQVQQRFPDVGPQTPEGTGATAHLTEANLETEVMDRDAMIEFNFEHDRLYSYYYHIDELGCTEAEELYGELQDFYSGYYGEMRTEDEDEGGYRARSSFWRMHDAQSGIAVTLSEQADECRLGWGFQQPAP